MGKKILIFHFRVGETDGVSLEINAWKEILEKRGFVVETVSGFRNTGADYVVEHFENQLDPEIYKLDEEAFGGFKDMSEKEFERKYLDIQNHLKRAFVDVVNKAKPNGVIVSNVFAVGENISAAGALVACLDKLKVPTLAVNHDFYWENVRYAVPSCQLVENELNQYYPPDRPYMKHAVINSLAQLELNRIKGIDADILYDTLDFERKIERDIWYWKLLRKYGVRSGDIVVLQATRVVRRKNIELAIDLVKKLEEKFFGQTAVKLYDDRRFHPGKNKIWLVASGYVEKRDEPYFVKLKNYASAVGVNFAALDGAYLGREKGIVPILKLHKWADMVTYPSEYEGFGNQFLEAIFSKKPVVLFEYPVFKIDIAPKGFKYLSLGRTVVKDLYSGLSKADKGIMESAASKTKELITNSKNYDEMVNKNFDLGKMYFSFDNAYRVLYANLLNRMEDDVQDDKVKKIGLKSVPGAV